jgi:GNAT superfamily N-acetyltransferase
MNKVNSITLRYGTAADNALLAELGAETFRDTFGEQNTAEDMAAYLAGSFSPEKQAAELAEPGSVFLIAEISGEVVGFVRLHEGERSVGVTGERPIEIVRIYARKAWIGKGVGPFLMQACLDEAAKRECDTIWLGVWEQNPRGIAFYKKWGFQVVGNQSFKLGNDLQHDFVMQRAVKL